MHQELKHLYEELITTNQAEANVEAAFIKYISIEKSRR